MIISHKHRFIFLKTRKTAGSSIELALSSHCGPDDVIAPMVSENRQGQNHLVPRGRWTARETARAIIKRRKPMFHEHAPAALVARWIGPEIWNSYLKFAIERNPWARYVSQYYWNTREGGASEGLDIREHFRQAETWRKSNWDIYAIGDAVVVDRLLRFENLEVELAAVTQKLGLPRLDLPRAKSTHKRSSSHYSQVLPADVVESIEKTCAREIAFLGYTFENASD